ncbi:RNAse H-fold protein YqgF [Bacteroidales bacterium 6E]|nr:RNAse H-fold protein YqgF [Bacteroidales bacterium 6E]
MFRREGSGSQMMSKVGFRMSSVLYSFFLYFCILILNNSIAKGLGRILAIDYGKKRVGLAVTDPLQMIASRLDTVMSNTVWSFLDDYFKKEQVDRVIIGYPRQLNNEPSESVIYLNPFLKTFSKRYPDMPIELADERFTSKLAHQAMIEGGLKKSDRRNKELVDGISATIILQSWLEQNRYKI